MLVGAGVCFGLALWSGFGVALAAEVWALTGEEVGAALGKDGALYLTFIGTEAKLKHFHYDTFVLDGILGELPAGVPAHFHTAEVGGEIDSVALPLVTEQGGALVRFLKK